MKKKGYMRRLITSRRGKVIARRREITFLATVPTPTHTLTLATVPITRASIVPITTTKAIVHSTAQFDFLSSSQPAQDGGAGQWSWAVHLCAGRRGMMASCLCMCGALCAYAGANVLVSMVRGLLAVV